MKRLFFFPTLMILGAAMSGSANADTSTIQVVIGSNVTPVGGPVIQCSAKLKSDPILDLEGLSYVDVQHASLEINCSDGTLKSAEIDINASGAATTICQSLGYKDANIGTLDFYALPHSTFYMQKFSLTFENGKLQLHPEFDVGFVDVRSTVSVRCNK